MSDFNEKLSQILQSFGYASMETGVENSKRGYLYEPIDDSLPEVLQAIRTLVLEEIIGTNEKTNQLESPAWNFVGGQNALRAEQRKKLGGTHGTN